MTIYFAIVDGDPISSGGHVHVFESNEWIEGPDGRRRAVAYLGDKAWCEACQTWGIIVPLSRVPNHLRTHHHKRGYQAVSDDGVVCKCESMPQVLAVYGRREQMRDTTDATSVANQAQALSRDIYDERFILADHDGKPLPGIRYRVRIGSNVVASGVTDAGGCTHRINTEDARRLILEIGGGT